MSIRASVALVLSLAFLPAAPQASIQTPDIASLYENALKQFAAKELEAAAAGLKTAIENDREFLAAHVLLAQVYLEQGNGSQAEKELRIALRLGADQRLVVLPLADAYLQQRKFQQLLEAVRSGDFDAELNAKILLKRGDALLQLGQLDEALFAYREAAFLAPASSAPLLGQAGVLIASGDLEGAEQLVMAALDRDHLDPEAWQLKGTIAHARVRLEEALRHYTHALELDPGRHVLRVARAGVYLDLDQDKAALADLELLSQRDLFDPQIPYLLGVVQARLGQADASRESMQKANEILLALPRPVLRAHGETLLLASLVAYSLGEWEKAREGLKEYVTLHPNSLGGRKLLASILFQNAEHNRAIRLLEPALDQAPEDLGLLVLLARAYLDKGWSVVASEKLGHAVALGADDAETKTLLGVALLASGRQEEGVAQLRALFEQDNAARRAGITLVGEYLRQGQAEAALEVARTLSQRHPQDLALLNLLAAAEVASGDLQAAETYYLRILESDPELLAPAINLVKIERTQGRLVQAGERLDELARAHPNNGLVLSERARLASLEGRSDEAIGWMEKAVALNESSLPQQLYLGELYLEARAYGPLAQLGQKLERLFPGEVRVKHLIGRASLAQGRLGKARNEFRSMSKLAGDNARAYAEAGRLSRAAGDLEWAAWSLNNAIKIKPAWLEPRVQLAEVYLEAGKLDQAADVISYLRERHAQLVLTYRLQGDLALARGRANAAVEAYRKALEQGGDERIALRLFRAYLETNELTSAVALLQQRWSREGSAGHPAEAKALAEGYLRLGRPAAAQSVYEQLVNAGLHDAAVLNNLAMLYAAQEPEQALEIARRAHRLDPHSPAISDTLGWLLVETGSPSEGLLYLRNAHSRAASDRGIRFHIASALASLERHDEALLELEAILADDNTFDDRAAALALRDRLHTPN